MVAPCCPVSFCLTPCATPEMSNIAVKRCRNEWNDGRLLDAACFAPAHSAGARLGARPVHPAFGRVAGGLIPGVRPSAQGGDNGASAPAGAGHLCGGSNRWGCRRDHRLPAGLLLAEADLAARVVGLSGASGKFVCHTLG